MPGLRMPGRVTAAASLLALCAGLGACSSSPFSGSSSSSGGSSSFGSSFTQMFSGSSANASAATAAAEETSGYCPPVDVRQGASTLSIVGAAPADKATGPEAMQLRYQGSIAQMARECATRGGEFNIRVGIQGRVVLGPVGGPGQIDIPLRFAVVQEGPEPKTIWTKLYRIPVVIAEGQSSVPFTYIVEDLSVPKPRPAELESYIVYVGFDALAAKPEPPKKKPAPKKRS